MKPHTKISCGNHEKTLAPECASREGYRHYTNPLSFTVDYDRVDYAGTPHRAHGSAQENIQSIVLVRELAVRLLFGMHHRWNLLMADWRGNHTRIETCARTHTEATTFNELVHIILYLYSKRQKKFHTAW